MGRSVRPFHLLLIVAVRADVWPTQSAVLDTIGLGTLYLSSQQGRVRRNASHKYLALFDQKSVPRKDAISPSESRLRQDREMDMARNAVSTLLPIQAMTRCVPARSCL